jgi:hypothetical protein
VSACMCACVQGAGGRARELCRAGVSATPPTTKSHTREPTDRSRAHPSNQPRQVPRRAQGVAACRAGAHRPGARAARGGGPPAAHGTGQGAGAGRAHTR